MTPLSVVLAMTFFAIMVIVGLVLAVWGTQKLRSQGRPNRARLSGSVLVSLDVLILAFGLSLAILGVIATFRVMWGS